MDSIRRRTTDDKRDIVAETESNYCFRCGKHVRKDGGRCWYCYAPVRRVIRPPRKCPYCDEEIGSKAVKCPHCGEFLDGPSSRDVALAQAAARLHSPQITYVIDKAVIQGDQPLMLQGGRPIPPEVSGLLTERTVRAIQMNNPALIDQDGIKALPAPDGEPVGDPQTATVSSRAIERHTVESERNLSRDASGESRGGSFLERLADFALGRIEEPAKEPITLQATSVQTEETPEEKKYANCNLCHTEVLASDNYCFHCGTKLRDEEERRAQVTVLRPMPSNAGLFLLAIVLMTASVAILFVPAGAQGAGIERILLPAAALMLLIVLPFLIYAFFRRRTSLNQLTTLILLLTWGVAACLVGLRFL